MRPLRFCMVTTFYPPFSFGGDAVFVYRLAHALGDLGHEVDVVHSEDAYRLSGRAEPSASFAEHPRVHRHPLRSRWPRLAALAAHQLGAPAAYRATLGRLLEAGNHDVIHFHNISLAGGPGVLGLGRALKLYTPHEYWLVCPTHVLFKYNREACRERACLRCTLRSLRPPQLWRHTGALERATRHVDLFLMPSRFALERHRRDGLDAPMQVLPNFVPEPAPEPEPETYPAPGADAEPAGRAAGPPERPYFLFVGRLERLKGVADLLELFRDYREADLRIVGDGEQREALEREARALPHVRLLGALHPQAVGQHYRNARAVIVPSLCYEVFPLIAAEALIHGTPIVARRIGALSEIVEESGGGFLFDTLAECRSALETLGRDPRLAAELGARGRRTALEHWTAKAHLKRYLGLIEERLGARGAQR